MSNLNLYELLNASATSTFEELKRNYKQLILQCHPDKLQQQQQQQKEQSIVVTVNANKSDPNRESDNNFNAINEAWNTLKDPIKRKHYDAELLQTKFQTHSNIYANITLNDMQRTRLEIVEVDEGEADAEEVAMDTEKKNEKGAKWSFAYAYNCRCGGQYILDDDVDDDESDEQREQLKAASEMIVECSECSLVIIVVKPVVNKP